MHNYKLSCLLLCLSTAMPATADSLWNALPDIPEPASVADDAEGGSTPEEKDAFKGSVELGYLASSGNSETTSLNGKLVLEYEVEKWRHGFLAQAIRATTDDLLTSERYQASAKSDYKFTEYNYFFGVVNYDRDEFSGFTRRTSEALGYGRRIMETEKHVLDAELGVGARQTTLVDGTEQNDNIARFGMNYNWTISDTSSFSQTLAVESGDLNTYSESVTAVTANLMSQLALKVSYTIKRNSDVPVGVENTDTYTAVSVLYSF